MVRNYIRKTQRRAWTPTELSLAVNAVKNGSSKNAAAREYNIPKKTLLRYLEKAVSPSSVQPLGSIKKVFTDAQELQLVQYIIRMSESFYGLTPKDVRSLAFQLAEINGIRHPFKRSTGLAGGDWFAIFRKRHLDLSLRSAEQTSLARARGFNRKAVADFYQLLTDLFSNHSYPPSRVWNMDQTGVTTVCRLVHFH